MRLLVIGGNGFLGSNFIRYVLGHYHAEFVTNVDAEIHPGNNQNLHAVPETYGDRYEFFSTDVQNLQVMTDILSRHRYFAVIHFTSTGSLPATPELLKITSQHRVKRFVHVASSGLASMDTTVLNSSTSNEIEPIILRCDSIYGPNQWALETLPTWIRRVLEGISPTGNGLTSAYRDWLHVNDMCAAIIATMLEGVPGTLYTAGPDAALPDTLVENWIDAAIHRKPFLEEDTVATFPPQIDSTRLRADLKWHPIIEPQDGIRDVVHWYLTYRARLLPSID